MASDWVDDGCGLSSVNYIYRISSWGTSILCGTFSIPKVVNSYMLVYPLGNLQRMLGISQST